MGCFWSSEGGDGSQYSSPRASARSYKRNTGQYGFGKYRCPCCSRFWISRRAWEDDPQGCRTCTEHCEKHATKNCSQCWVYPHLWRPLTADEMRSCNDSEKDHIPALCGRCRRLGHHCGNIARARSTGRNGHNKPKSSSNRRNNGPAPFNFHLPHNSPPSYNAAVRQNFNAKRFRKY